jgi:hypothetical protein
MLIAGPLVESGVFVRKKYIDLDLGGIGEKKVELKWPSPISSLPLSSQDKQSESV